VPSPYRKILVAIDGSDESPQVLSRAAGVLSGNDGELHLIHVIEPLALAYGADVPMDVTDLQSGLMKQAREMADKYAGQYNIPEANVYVDMGSIEKTILDKADKIGGFDRGGQPYPQWAGPAAGLNRTRAGARGSLRRTGRQGRSVAATSRKGIPHASWRKRESGQL